MGQCNDAYSAIQVALALADAFKVGVNDLPLSMILSWYEQKAAAILLTLLYLGIKDIRLGPTLPAFLTPDVAKFIVDNYQLEAHHHGRAGSGDHPRLRFDRFPADLPSDVGRWESDDVGARRRKAARPALSAGSLRPALPAGAAGGAHSICRPKSLACSSNATTSSSDVCAEVLIRLAHAEER